MSATAHHPLATPRRSPSTRPQAAEVMSAVGAVTRSGRRAVRRRWPVPRLSPPQAELLHHIDEHPGAGVGEAAAALHLAPNTVSTLVGRLVDRGFVLREPDPHDGRAVRLVLTPAAERRIEDWRDLRADVAAQAFVRLDTADRAALRAAAPALRRLAAALGDLDTDA